MDGYEAVGWGDDLRCDEGAAYLIVQTSCLSDCNLRAKSECDKNAACNAFEYDISGKGITLFKSCAPYKYDSPSGRWGGRFRKCSATTASTTTPTTTTAGEKLHKRRFVSRCRYMCAIGDFFRAKLMTDNQYP